MKRTAIPNPWMGLLALPLLLPLSACMNLSGLSGGSKYACTAPEGVACESVSGTYANAEHRRLPSQQRTGAAASGSPAVSPGVASLQQAHRREPLAAADGITLATPGEPPRALRSQARYLRLWVKPWEDLDGDLFDQAHVYVQIDHGRWQIDHIRQRIREQFAPLRPPFTPTFTPPSRPTAETADSRIEPTQDNNPVLLQQPSSAQPRPALPTPGTPPTPWGRLPQ